MDRLQTLSAEPVLRSSLWQTTPVDCPPDSPLFVNAAVGLVPLVGETPESLLAKLQAIERELDRVNASIAVWKKRPGPQQQAVLSQLEKRAEALERRKAMPRYKVLSSQN